MIRAVVSVLRRVPRLVAREAAEERRQRDLLRYQGAETDSATWICPLHSDAWRRPDGTLRRLVGGIVLPLSEEDAEDFHGYGWTA